MTIKEKKLNIKNLKAFYMDDWELTEEQKDQLDALATDILNVGIEQGKLESSANREGYKLVPIKCTNNMAHAAKEVDGRLSAFKYGDVWEAMIGACDE